MELCLDTSLFVLKSCWIKKLDTFWLHLVVIETIILNKYFQREFSEIPSNGGVYFVNNTLFFEIFNVVINYWVSKDFGT